MELEQTIRRAAASPRRRRDERLRRLDRRHNAFVRHAIDAESCAGRGARPFDGDGAHRGRGWRVAHQRVVCGQRQSLFLCLV